MTNVARVVLITGVGRGFGSRIAERLSADPAIDRIIAVDTVPPRPGTHPLGRAEFVRADIRHPLIGKVLDQARVDTVVHPGPVGVTHRHQHLRGTAALLRACAQAPTVTRVVAGSSTAVYSAGPHDPAVFTEDMRACDDTASGSARLAVEAEALVRTLARSRPDVVVGVLRLAEVIGPTSDTWLTRYLALPVVPTSLGYDPRLQLLHEADAVEVFRHVLSAPRSAVVNVASDGVLTLSQALRWAGRVRLPLPRPAFGTLGLAARAVGLFADDRRYLEFGRVVDITRLTRELGFTPRHTSAQALRSYLDTRPGLPHLAVAALSGAQHALLERVPRA